MKKIMFCGGGSAGHVIPNLALCERLKDFYDVCYIGTDGIEKSICCERGIKFYEFEGAKLVRGKFIKNLALPFKLHKSIKQCQKIISAQKPDLLFCKGGYVSYPPAVAASRAGIPVLAHESDISLGLANKLIARRCVRMLTAFPSTAEKIKNGIYVGTPMRSDIFDRDKYGAKRKLGLDMRPTILVFGGGHGSEKINKILRQSLIKLCENYNVIHLCGKGRAVDNNLYGYKQIEFTDDMGLIYACADYAVARCGSNSAHELIALKIPALFIPLDNKSTRGDQIANAEYFESLGVCKVLPEKLLDGESLIKSIDELMRDKNIKTALNKSAVVNGTDRIYNEIKSVLR